MFTRLSNFTYGNYTIANIQDNSVDSDVALKIHIQKYEAQCLQLILGDSLYEELLTNVELDGEYYKVKNSAEQKWKDLVNGKKYTIDNSISSSSSNDRVWSGLVKKVAEVNSKSVFETLMASYIFYYWSLNYRTLNIGVGEVRLKSKSATQESSSNKRIDAWNEFVQWTSFGYSSTNVSLYAYLNNHREDFPTASTTCLNTMTYYDL